VVKGDPGRDGRVRTITVAFRSGPVGEKSLPYKHRDLTEMVIGVQRFALLDVSLTDTTDMNEIGSHQQIAPTWSGTESEQPEPGLDKEACRQQPCVECFPQSCHCGTYCHLQNITKEKKIQN
jgi:hypothetical protein